MNNPIVFLTQKWGRGTNLMKFKAWPEKMLFCPTCKDVYVKLKMYQNLIKIKCLT